MGETKKLIKQEIKSIYKSVLSELDESQKRLDDNEKAELRAYIEELSDGSCHAFSHIFIKRKIENIIKSRNDMAMHDTGDIDKLVEDEGGEPFRTSINTDLKWLLEKHSVEEIIDELGKLLPEKYSRVNLVEGETNV